jgi:hypothetical protein
METGMSATRHDTIDQLRIRASAATLTTANPPVLAHHFLSRLERLVQLRKTEAERLTDQGIQLLDRTIYSTLCDCIDSGASEVARAILRGGATPEVRIAPLTEAAPVGPCAS